jgi:hypothetical protein
VGSSAQGSWDAPVDDAGRRRRLANLDAALGILEAAHDLGLEVMTPRLWSQVSARCPGVAVNQTIAEAIEQVFEAQEPLMVRPHIEQLSIRPRGARETLPLGLGRREDPATATPLVFRPARHVRGLTRSA